MSQALLEFLEATQRECGGVIPVERYMQEALFHPEFGYYSKNIRGVGRRGDFATSASLGESLGTAIARWAWEQKLPLARGRWHLIEAGAGSGELARTILRRLGLLRRRGLTYHIVETSPVLREEQRRALPQFRVKWHDSMADALNDCEGTALIFSNELVDAFPCRLYERRRDRWFEVGVRITGTRVTEELFDRPPVASSGFAEDAPEGQRVEVQPAVAEWFATWAPAVCSARLLTIDYGDTMPTLYHRRPRGTLRGYFHHQRVEGLEVYHRFGKQDLTCDVNFSDLRAWTERCGWSTDALVDQSQFLRSYGIPRSTGLHDAQLAEHTGAGSAFKVLVQSKGASRRHSLPQSLN